ALARRSANPLRERTVLRADDLVLDRLSRTVRRAGREIDLLPLEFKLLEFLLLHAGQIVTRTMLLERVWGFHFDPRTNIVETHISRLRAKLDGEGAVALISTVRGAGYVIGAA
ncbi:MAG: winged helix-turn-helix domain-containing protein, partial [Caulobacteraceae bacterium]